MSVGRRAGGVSPLQGADLAAYTDDELATMQAQAKSVVARSKALILNVKGEMDRAGDLARRIGAERRKRKAESRDTVSEDTHQRRGGLARAASMTPGERKAVATRAANARWRKDG